MRKWISRLMILAAMCLLLYNPVMSWFESKRQSDLIASMTQEVSEISDTDKEAMFELARQYNDDPESVPYEDVIPLPDGLICSLSIPCISVELPVYHSEDPDVLKNGAGHREKSDFPIGETGCRAVISAHSGMAGTSLFTRLDEVKMGDSFYIDILGKTFAYQVCDIQTVLPDELDAIQPDPQKDLVTLYTCTPYGINTHRLLVTGERVEMPESEYWRENNYFDWSIAWFIGVPAGGFLLIWLVERRGKKKAAAKQPGS